MPQVQIEFVTQAATWTVAYKGSHSQGALSTDIYDMEAAGAMKGLGVSQLEVTVMGQKQPRASLDFRQVFSQKALPAKKTSRPTELPTILHNHLIDLLEKDFPTARWHRGALETDAQPLLDSMATILSFLQGSANQLSRRTGRLPDTLVPLTQVKIPGGSGSHKKAIVLEHVIDDPKQPANSLNSVPSQTRERFYQAYCKLLQCLNQPWALRPEFKEFAEEAWLLAKVITGYYDQNKKGAAAQRARAAATEPTRAPGQESCTRTVAFRRKGECPLIFKELWTALEQANPFEPLIVDHFLPEGHERYTFLRQLTKNDVAFPSATYLYQHYTGNRLSL